MVAQSQCNKQYNVRLQHIDYPESAQDFGGKAKKALSAKVFGKVVTIKWEATDRYKRILGDVYVGKQWVNLEMVKEGMAWHFYDHTPDCGLHEPCRANEHKTCPKTHSSRVAGPQPNTVLLPILRQSPASALRVERDRRECLD